MERKSLIPESTHFEQQALSHRIAFHEAGHAAAIYFGNQNKQLPPVHFAIKITKPSDEPFNWEAQIQDGQLIHDLATANGEITGDMDFKKACESDVMNMLVGPLAEARYVAERDGELFHPDLMTLPSLKRYGGWGDLDRAYGHLKNCLGECCNLDKELSRVFNQALMFISSDSYWRAISNLAQYVLSSQSEIIDCHEIIQVLEA